MALADWLPPFFYAQYPMPNNKQNTQLDPGLVKASELAGLRLSKFIDWLQQIVPQLTRTEATYLTSGVLKLLPEVFENNPLVIAQIRQQAQQIISQRK